MTNHPNSRRSAGLIATAAAAGITAALTLAASAASLNTNLVVNGDFESVVSTIPGGGYFSGWTGGNFGAPTANTPFGYSYSQSYDNRLAGAVPAGNIASSTTDYYWSMNGWDENAFQMINLAAGDSGASILAGTAQYDIRAYFTGFAADLETGRISLQFADSSNFLIGSATNFDAATNDFWSQVGGTGAIPTNAASAVITLTRNPASGVSAGPDSYADNVSFVVIPEPSGLLIGITGAGLLALRRKRL